jgi:hypothetical protein
MADGGYDAIAERLFNGLAHLIQRIDARLAA